MIKARWHGGPPHPQRLLSSNWGLLHMVDPATERREDQESSPDRRRARLQQAQRLESLGQLAAGIAEDFNDLLAVILRYAAFVSAELAAPSGPDRPERLESVRR